MLLYFVFPFSNADFLFIKTTEATIGNKLSQTIHISVSLMCIITLFLLFES